MKKDLVIDTRKFVFDEEVYNKKFQFIMRCRHISECSKCNNYNKRTGCKDPEYPKGRLLKEKEANDAKRNGRLPEVEG